MARDAKGSMAPMAPQAPTASQAKMAPMAKMAGEQPRDSRGRWANGGAAVGDHQAEQPANTALRNVPGHGILPASAPVAMHNGTPSVGVSPRLTRNARERVAIGRELDARHRNR